MKAIEFKLKDGASEWYDPLEESDLTETDTHYIVKMGYTYEILKEDVESYHFHDTCDHCGYTLDICDWLNKCF